MKKINIFLILLLTYTAGYSQWGPTAVWTWVTGSQTKKANSVFGTLGVPSISNTPGARYASGKWNATNGRLWLFGGMGIGQLSGGGSQTNFLNDLWVFDPVNKTWSWEGGSTLVNQPGSYGTKGIGSINNMPGARRWPLTWVDNAGNFWLFGGDGFGESATSGGSDQYLNDFWKYNPSTKEWTWMGGNKTLNNGGTYGTRTVSDPTNIPGSRYNSVTWSVGNKLYLFGGYGYDGSSTPILGWLNDLWVYDIPSGQWTWLTGSTTANSVGSYGAVNTPDPNNNPISREGAVGWYYNNKLWLYGGAQPQSPSNPFDKYYSDFWEYDPTTNEWILLYGDNTPNGQSVQGVIGSADPSYHPGARSSGVGWINNAGNLELFAGSGYISNGTKGHLDDLWQYNTTTGLWSLEKGDDNINVLPVYGTKGLSDPANKPGGRRYITGWTDNGGNFWTFGGQGYDVNGSLDKMNDMWELSSGTAPIPPVDLPVKFASFTATRSNMEVLLKWQTAEEINASRFIVEHSTDGRNFTPIGVVAATGNSDYLISYYYTDKAPVIGINYYRLKEVDLDGKFEYSDVRQVSFTGGALSLSVLGNPFRSSLQFRVSSPTNEKATIQLSDINGKTLLQKPVELQTGDNVMSVDGSGFAAGIYILSVNSSAGLRQVKVVKQ